MTIAHQSQVSQAQGNGQITTNTEWGTSLGYVPLTTRDAQSLAVLQNDGRTAQSQIDGSINASESIELDLSRYLPFMPFAPQPKETFRMLQKWEGYVLEVSSETFWARLTPLVGEEGDQEAEIYLNEIDGPDQRLVQLGAVFYWSIGYLNRPSGRIRASILRFQRLPGWTKGEIQNAEAAAERMEALFGDK